MTIFPYPRMSLNQKCGYADVRRTTDGRYRCMACLRFMPDGYEAALKGAGLELPKPEKQP